MGQCKADRPPNGIGENNVDHDAEPANIEDVLVHDQDRRFDESETNDRDHV